MVKPEIRNLNLSDEKIRELNQILTDTKKPKQTRVNMVKHITGGFCCSCSKVPTKLASWELDGIQLIERYCPDCFQKNEKYFAKRDRSWMMKDISSTHLSFGQQSESPIGD